MCVQACPVLVCVSAHQMHLALGTVQIFEPHLIRSCLLAQGCASMTLPAMGHEFLFAQGPLNPALSSAEKLCQKQAPPRSGIYPGAQRAVGTKGAFNILSPSLKSWNNIRNWGVSGLGFAAAML